MYGCETHDVMTPQENKYEYNAKSIFNFSMNDMHIRNNAIFNFNSAIQK